MMMHRILLKRRVGEGSRPATRSLLRPLSSRILVNWSLNILGIVWVFTVLPSRVRGESQVASESQVAVVQQHLVAISDQDVLSMRISTLDQPAANMTLEKLIFGDSKSLKLESALRKLLDHDSDGQVTGVELQTAEPRLLELDLDDDECLVPLEISKDLLTVVPKVEGSAGTRAAELVLMMSAQDLSELQEVLTKFSKTNETPLEHVDLTLVVDPSNGSIAHVSKAPDSTVIVEHLENSARFRILKGNLEFDLWADVRPILRAAPPARATATTDPLATAAPAALPSGIQTRPGRRGWFEWLDVNGDSRLSRSELSQAAKILTNNRVPGPNESVTHSFAIRVGQPGTFPRTFIPLLDQNSRLEVIPSGPLRWFAAMDTNQDGTVSKNEFLGGDLLFERADKNRDGWLSAEEASELKPVEKPAESILKGSTP